MDEMMSFSLYEIFCALQSQSPGRSLKIGNTVGNYASKYIGNTDN